MDTMALSAPTLSSTLSTASILYGGNNNSLTSIEQNTIIEKLKELHKLLSTCEERRLEHEENLDSINKTQERMQNDSQKLYYKQKLKGLYKVSRLLVECFETRLTDLCLSPDRHRGMR